MTESSGSLAGKSVIVTGGARGLGRAMTGALLDAGASVLVADIDIDTDELTATRHARLRAVATDVTNPPDAEKAVAACAHEFGTVDALVNNAGILMREVRKKTGRNDNRFWDVDDALLRWFFDVHVVGSFTMSKAALPYMRERGTGRIIMITTSFSTMLGTGRIPYGPVKASMEALAAVMAKDLAGSGITVNVLIPGHAQAAPGTRPQTLPARRIDGRREAPRFPVSIMGPPVVWLASDASSGTTAMRFVAERWDAALDPNLAALAAAAPVAWGEK